MPHSARILMILSNGFTHDPRVSNEASSLTRAGYEVTVLCWDHEGTLPPDEVRDGVRVVRLRNTAGMTLRGFDLFRLRPFWRLALRRALDLHAATPFSAIHSHDLDTLPVGVQLKERIGIPLVYDAHEFFEYMMEVSRARLWAGRFAELERRLAPRANLVIATGPPHRDYLSLVTKAPIVIVMNSRPLLYETYEPPPTKRMTVLYLGRLNPGRLLKSLAELALEDASIDVQIGGTGPLAGHIRRNAARSTGNLRYVGLVPMDDVLPLTRAADLVFSVFDPTMRLYQVAVPNKFFEALVAGRPILVSRDTWMGREVEAAACGLAISYSKDSLREALRLLQEDPALRERLGRNALRLAQERYNWPRDEVSLLDAYSDLIASTSLHSK